MFVWCFYVNLIIFKSIIFFQKGYTFMAEAQTGEIPVIAGKWKLRLINSYSPLPILSREAVNNVYSIKEVKDYYVPNDKHIIFR